MLTNQKVTLETIVTDGLASYSSELRAFRMQGRHAPDVGIYVRQFTYPLRSFSHSVEVEDQINAEHPRHRKIVCLVADLI